MLIERGFIHDIGLCFRNVDVEIWCGSCFEVVLQLDIPFTCCMISLQLDCSVCPVRRISANIINSEIVRGLNVAWGEGVFDCDSFDDVICVSFNCVSDRRKQTRRGCSSCQARAYCSGQKCSSRYIVFHIEYPLYI